MDRAVVELDLDELYAGVALDESGHSAVLVLVSAGRFDLDARANGESLRAPGRIRVLPYRTRGARCYGSGGELDGNQALIPGNVHGLDAIADAELRVDVGAVKVDGPLADRQVLGYFGAGPALREPDEDLAFRSGEEGREGNGPPRSRSRYLCTIRVIHRFLVSFVLLRRECSRIY